MDWLEVLEIGDAERIAIGYTQLSFRAQLATYFALDRRLGQLVAQTSEPMLGQMRLAWWRDVLKQAPEARPSGDIVLDSIGDNWAGMEEKLIALVDGWEHMLAEPPLGQVDARAFIEGRIAPLADLFDEHDSWETAARRWACADATAHTSQEEERALFIAMGLEDEAKTVRLPAALRGLAVLGALGLRALKRGGRPLLDGRGAALTALRVGIIGK